MEKVSFEFSDSQLTLMEKVVEDLKKRLIRDKEIQPEATLWSDNPTLFTDVDKLQKQLVDKKAVISTTEIIANMIISTIRFLNRALDHKTLKSKYGANDTKMKQLYLIVSNELK